MDQEDITNQFIAYMIVTWCGGIFFLPFFEKEIFFFLPRNCISVPVFLILIYALWAADFR